MDEAGDRTLRAKYLDWCSARIAERFLDLSPEEIYELAYPRARAAVEGERGERGRGSSAPGPERAHRAGPAGAPDVLLSPDEEDYRALVQRVTESLLGRMSLPTFEQWAEAYAEAPGRFEAEMLGFWKE